METAMGPPTKIEHNGLALQVSHLPYLKVPDVGKNVLFSEMQPCGLDSQSSIVAARKVHVTRFAQAMPLAKSSHLALQPLEEVRNCQS